MVGKLVTRWRSLLQSLVFLSGLIALHGYTDASPQETLALSDQEKRWLVAHPVVRVGVDGDYAPYSFFDKQGRFQGVAAEFSTRVADLLGIRLEVVPGLSWPQILNAARAHRIDLIPTAVRLPERKAYLSFSEIYIPTPLVIVTRNETPGLTRPEDLAHMQVALVKQYSSSQQALQRYPAIKPYFVTTPIEGLRAVASGKADAYIGVLGINTYLMSLHGLGNLKINAAFDMEQNGQRFAVRKDWAILARLVDKALRAIPAVEKQAIFNRWLPVRAEQIPFLGARLSTADRRWLSSHRRLRVGVQRNNAPFDFIDSNGQHAGIAADYLELIEQNTRLIFERVVADDQDQLMKMLRGDKVDLVAAVASSRRHSNGIVLSRPYHHTSLMMFSRAETHYSGSIDELDEKVIAVRRGGLAPIHLDTQHHDHLLGVDNFQQALQAVADQRADVALLAATPALNELESGGLSGVRAAALLSDSDIPLRFAARAEWSGLIDIINHLLTTVTVEQKSLILRKWLIRSPVEVLDRTVVMRWVLGTGIVIALLYLAILFWNQQLRHKIARRTREVEKLLQDRESALATLQESEERLKEAHAGLELRVEERTAELQVANQELETFGYSVSHDLRAPLRAISGFSETLKEEYGNTLDAPANDYIYRIQNGCRRMTEMIEGLLKLSRSSRGMLERTQIDLSALAAEVIDELRATDPTHQPSVNIQAGITAYGDIRLLECVLENILGNAWKYTVGCTQPRISFFCKRQGDGWIYIVEDNGAGFDMAYADQLFTPFQRLHSQEAYPGIGIGLATVERIIHRHGGEIHAHSTPGEGTRFSFTLRPGIFETS